MAYTQANMTCVVGMNGWSMWQYRSTVDNLATIRASGYFNAMQNVINTGDAIWIGPDSTNAAGGWDMLINTAGVITVAAITALAATQSYGATGDTGATGAHEAAHPPAGPGTHDPGHAKAQRAAK
jgi:hypothetical protein